MGLAAEKLSNPRRSGPSGWGGGKHRREGQTDSWDGFQLKAGDR